MTFLDIGVFEKIATKRKIIVFLVTIAVQMLYLRYF